MLRQVLSMLWKRSNWQQETDVSDPRFPPAWCYYALLYSAAFADNVLAEAEEDEVLALRHRSRTLIRVGDEQADAWISQYQELLAGSNHVYPLVDLACDKLLPGDGRELSIFIHCADLIYADRQVAPDEQEFLDILARKLAIPSKQRDDALTVIGWKHAL